MKHRKELMVLCNFNLKGQLTNQDYYRSIHNMANTEATLKVALLTPVIAPSLHRSCWQQKNSKLSNWKKSAISFILHWDAFQQEKVLNLPNFICKQVSSVVRQVLLVLHRVGLLSQW